jgi:hypothetical protein
MLCFVLYLTFLIFIDPNDMTWTTIDDKELDPEKDGPSKTGKKISARTGMKGFDEGIMACRPESRRSSRDDMRNISDRGSRASGFDLGNLRNNNEPSIVETVVYILSERENICLVVDIR